MRLVSQRVLTSGFLAGAIIYLGLAAFSYRGVSESVSDARWVARTHQVTEGLGRLYARVLEAETGQRGYTITGDPDHLRTVGDATAAAGGELRGLRELIADAQQLRNLDLLEPVVAEKLALVRQIVELHGERGERHSLELTRSGRGKALMDDIRARLRAMEARQGELLRERSERSEGSSRRAYLWLSFGTASGFAIFWLVFHLLLKDVRQRRRAEEELSAARDAALESARLKSEFLANMSHEIRTPMNGVLGMTDLLLGTPLDPRQREYAESAKESAEALLAIIDDILDFSKIEANQMRFENVAFDPRGVVEGAVEVLAHRAHAKGLELGSFVEAGVPPHVLGDPGRLRQVLLNLIGNAVKFTHEGEVFVRVSADGGAVAGGAATLRFEVRDTGIGLSEEGARRLFTPFTQADGSTTRRYGGTGLGLAITKQLVEMMGGAVGVESAEGAGSTFWFTARFPVAEAPPEAGGAAGGPADLAGARVLVVDDNATNRKILSRQTESWGMVAEECDSGAGALRALREAAARSCPFDVAILDLQMPGMDGFDLARVIKADSAVSGVSLVLMPSFTQRGHTELARELDIDAYLPKPVRQSKLYDCLASVLAGRAGGRGGRAPDAPLGERAAARPAPGAAEGFRVLVAEDNAVNRTVALRHLEALGYAADSVDDGAEAVRAVARGGYDLVLMDCQMPVMDGYEATAEIRRREGGGAGGRRTVVVAVTANALEGDRERCLAAGMDDYISKPVRAEALRDVLERWLRRPAAGEAPEGGRPAAGGGQSILDALRDGGGAGGGDQARELACLFLAETRSLLDRLRAELGRGDLGSARRTAHGVKGACLAVGAYPMADLCRRVEEADDAREAAPLLPALEEEFDRVGRELQTDYPVGGPATAG